MQHLPGNRARLRWVVAAMIPFAAITVLVSCDIFSAAGAAESVETTTDAAANPTDALPFATADASDDATATTVDAGSGWTADASPGSAIDAAATEALDAPTDVAFEANPGASPYVTADATSEALPDAAGDTATEATAEGSGGVGEGGGAGATDAPGEAEIADASPEGAPGVDAADEGGVTDASEAGLADASSYSEATNGSFSSVDTAPTVLVVGRGSNWVTGVVGGGSADGEIDDYFEIRVPAGAALTSIVLTHDVSSSGPADLTFFAIAAGTSISSSDSTAAGMLGWVLFDASMVGTNLLPGMGQAGNGASGFTPPLGPGTYSFRVQDDDGSNVVAYQLELVLSTE